MKKVYIISRYRAKNRHEQEFNVAVARHFAKEVAEADMIPIVPHIYFTQFLNDENERERECGLGLGLFALRECDGFLLVIVDGVISEGMKAEIKEISRLGLPGQIVCLTRREAVDRIKTVV